MDKFGRKKTEKISLQKHQKKEIKGIKVKNHRDA
jgi:hypothetical protein